MIIVSTDGICHRSPAGAIGWAWVAHEGGRFDSGGAVSGTDQTAELTALLRAVEAHPGAEPLFVESGSQFAIRCASEWLDAWKRQGWRTPAGAPVDNLDLVQSLDAALVRREGPVRFRWVRGHVDNPFHERADQLAGLAAQDWAAGRGELDDLLVSPDDAGQVERSSEGAGQRPAAARSPQTVGARSEPGWELGTLFD